MKHVFRGTHKVVPPDSDTHAGSTLAYSVSIARNRGAAVVNLHTSRQSNESAIQRELCHHLQLLGLISGYAPREI